MRQTAVISAGYIVGAKIVGIIGQALGFEFSVVTNFCTDMILDRPFVYGNTAQNGSLLFVEV